MSLEFNDIKIEDKEWARGLLSLSDINTTDYNFSVMFLWRDIIHTQLARCGNLLVPRYRLDFGYGEKPCYMFPAGEGSDNQKRAVVEVLLESGKQHPTAPLFASLPNNQRVWLEENFPGVFRFEPVRFSYDYIYIAEDLINLSGKKYQSKRNFISGFERSHTWTFEPIDTSNIEEVKRMSGEWCRRYGCAMSKSLLAESCSVKRALESFFDLNLLGGIIRVFDGSAPYEGDIVAFTIGEKLNSDTLLVHIEKSFTELRGAYQIINREFLKYARHREEFKYVNREDDAGDEGLRKAKLSYHPVTLIEKWLAYPNF